MDFAVVVVLVKPSLNYYPVYYQPIMTKFTVYVSFYIYARHLTRLIMESYYRNLSIMVLGATVMNI